MYFMGVSILCDPTVCLSKHCNLKYSGVAQMSDDNLYSARKSMPFNRETPTAFYGHSQIHAHVDFDEEILHHLITDI